jgi:hypothetical protein
MRRNSVPSCSKILQGAPASAARRRFTNRASFRFDSACSQILTTRHPLAFSARFTRRSLARFPFNFRSQNRRFWRGSVPCRGQPCQKHPSTKTATRRPRNAKSGLPNKSACRRHPQMRCLRKIPASAPSVPVFPKDRIRRPTSA